MLKLFCCNYTFDSITVNLRWERNYTENGTVDNVEVCAAVITATERTITLNISYWDESACKFSIMYSYVVTHLGVLVLIYKRKTHGRVAPEREGL